MYYRLIVSHSVAQSMRFVVLLVLLCAAGALAFLQRHSVKWGRNCAGHREKYVQYDGYNALKAFKYVGNSEEVEISTGQNTNIDSKNLAPSPLDSIVDFNHERQAVIYEITLGRELGIDIIQGNGFTAVGEVYKDSKAELLGVKTGDIIVAISATAGDQLWSHNSVEGVKSALNTRFVMASTVKIRLERPLSIIPDSIKRHLKVPYIFNIALKRPIGMHVIEGEGKGVYVKSVKADMGAAKCGRVEVGDQVVAMSASWGDRMWEVNSVESFVVGVKMRTDNQLKLSIKRLVSLDQYISKQQRKFSDSVPANNNAPPSIGSADTYLRKNEMNEGVIKSSSYIESIEKCKTLDELLVVWNSLIKNDDFLGNIVVNKFMTQCLAIESPELAIEVFELLYDFNPDSYNSARSAYRVMNDDPTARAAKRKIDHSKVKKLEPNIYVCTTAVKAYGRSMDSSSALALFDWIENEKNVFSDIYFLSTLLYVLAKTKRVNEAEEIFWNIIPSRNLTYTVATTNSLMYMYAKLNRADDALKVYELTKSMGITCTVVTYGVLIKALLKSGKKKLQETSFEILRSLPDLNINPGIELYNQFLEHFAVSHDYRQAQNVMKLMSEKPKIAPDIRSYGYLINLCAETKRPKVALKLFHQMRRQKIESNAQTYMGVLKALAVARDGVNAVQVIAEMREKGVEPSLRHYAAALFACALSNQNMLASSLFSLAVRTGVKPDTALYTLYMRSLLQTPGKWDEGVDLYNRMLNNQELAKPNSVTIHCLLQFQITNGFHNEAINTLQKIIINYNRHMDKSSGSNAYSTLLNDDSGVVIPVSSLKPTFKVLNLALGSYSSELKKRNKEDKMFANNWVGINEQQQSMTPNSTVTDGTDDSSMHAMWNLPKPSLDALRFVTNACELICKDTYGYLQGDLYMELMRALVLEGLFDDARKILVLREVGQVRLSRDQEESASNLEEIANRLIVDNDKKRKSKVGI